LFDIHFKSVYRLRSVFICKILMVGIIIVFSPVHAAKKPLFGGKESTESIQITSDRMITNDTGNYGEFIGSVIATQGTFVLTADSLRIYYRTEAEKSRTPKSGMVKKIVASGDVKIISEDMNAVSQTAEYDVDQDVITLVGENSKVVSEGNSITGSRITFFRGSNRVKVERGKKKRVKAVFYSGKKAKDVSNEKKGIGKIVEEMEKEAVEGTAQKTRPAVEEIAKAESSGMKAAVSKSKAADSEPAESEQAEEPAESEEADGSAEPEQAEESAESEQAEVSAESEQAEVSAESEQAETGSLAQQEENTESGIQESGLDEGEKDSEKSGEVLTEEEGDSEEQSEEETEQIALSAVAEETEPGTEEEKDTSTDKLEASADETDDGEVIAAVEPSKASADRVVEVAKIPPVEAPKKEITGTPMGKLLNIVGLAPFRNRTPRTIDGFSELFKDRFAGSLTEDCGDVIFLTPGDGRYPAGLVMLPEHISGRVDNFSVAREGKAKGLNALISGSLIDVRPVAEKKKLPLVGNMWFLKSVPLLGGSEERTVQAVMQIDVYDIDTGTKILDRKFNSILDFGEQENKEDEEFIESEIVEKKVTSEIVKEAIVRIMPDMVDSICAALTDYSWKGYVVSTSDNKVTISSGSDSGLVSGNILEVYERNIVEGTQGHRFFIPGIKTGEIQLTEVYPDRSEAILISGPFVKEWSSVIPRE